MSYQLVLRSSQKAMAVGVDSSNKGNRGATKDVGEDVLFSNLPADYKVFLFYYPGEMPDPALETSLRRLGEQSGKNLFVNFGTLRDPNYADIVARFGIVDRPVIVMTAVADLASLRQDDATTFVRLDSKYLLDSAERTSECVQKLFNLFLTGKVSEAVSSGKWAQRKQVAEAVGKVVLEGLKAVVGFVASRDIKVSLLEGKFELTRSGG